MTTLDDHTSSTSGRDTVAGLIAVASVALSGIAMHAGFFLGVEARPARTAPIALVLAIVAGRMSERFDGTAKKAMLFSGLAWVVGMTIAVLTEAPLF
jgi:hypothetical protein